MKTQNFVAMFISLLIILCGCGASQEDSVPAAKPRSVRVSNLTSRDLPILVNSVGRLSPDRQVVLSAQVPGILMHYDADVGRKVAQKEPLVKLDDTDYTLALNEARANHLAAQVRLTAARNAFDRARRLLPENAITPELYDQSEAEYKSTKALVAQLNTMLALAQRRLDKTTISAPFDGYVTQRFVEVGQNVAIGDPLMTVAGMKTMRVKIYVNELDYVHLDEDDPVTVTVEAFSQTPTIGRVDKIGIQADARTNTFEVEILVDNPDFRLKAGLTARVVIQTKVIPDAVMIAQNAVIFRENRKEVFVVGPDNIAQAREVKLGRVEGSRVRVLEGLQPGETIVVAGGPYLKQGDKVVVAP
jgi:RND family efflux transporter MFP subunit